MHTESNEKLTIRVERAAKPSIHVDPSGSHVQVWVPGDCTVNHHPVSANVGLGYVVRLQRMQQQYKITLQHQHEKKPECVVYASALAHEPEIKTTVKEVNCRLPNMTIAGANLEVSGILKGRNLTFESTVGTLHVYAKIVCTSSLQLHSQNVVLSTEALLSTDQFKVICRKLQIDGRVFPLEPEDGGPGGEQKMRVDLSCSLVHIGVDGCIGASNERDKIKKMSRLKPVKQVSASHLHLTIAGGLANYGKISAKEHIDLNVSGSLLSLSDGSLDSAGRGYNALKQLRKVGATSGCAPSSSFMHSAIQNQNTGAVANLIEKGVDLNDRVSPEEQTRKRLTLRQSAMREYREVKQKSSLNSARERITLINALFCTRDWRRGSISAAQIVAVVARNCDDVAQFSAKQLQLKVGGSATVEKDSIWSCTWVEMDVGASLKLHGQVKLVTLLLHAGGAVTTTSDAILSFEIFARITCHTFECDGMWCTGENLVVDTAANVMFSSNSYVESNKLEMECGGTCETSGTWQLTACWAHVHGMFMVHSNAKLFVDDAADVSALGLHFHGFMHVTDNLDLQFQDSAHFFHSSRLECNALKLTCKAFCTIGGVIAAGDLHAYVRHEIITTSTGKLMVANDASVTSGSFKNDALWQVEKNMKLVVGTIEQSEDGILFVKCSLAAHIHEVCVDSFGGRIISSEVYIRSIKESHFDGLIRCNDMQIALPYSGESKMTLRGQVDVVVGCLAVVGNLPVDKLEPKDPLDAGLTIACSITASAIVAPFAAVHLDPTAVVRLSGTASVCSTEPNLLINAGWLSTAKESSVASMADSARTRSEMIVVATVFQHRGQIKFAAPEVRLLCSSLCYHGRLTNTENKQNHVKKLFIAVSDQLLNHGIIACDNLEIKGDGVLENTNRIYAVESMDIRLSNFNNDEGLIESKNTMKLLAVSKEWTKLGGSIKARKPVDVCANRLNMAIRNVQNLSVDKRLSFSAKTDLLISSDVIDEAKELSVGCAAQQSVAVDANMQLDRLEVLLGGDANSSEPVLFAVQQNANVIANTILISAKSEHLQIAFDGSVQCSRLRFAGGIRKVSITGMGQLECTYLAAQHSRIVFEMYNLVRLDEVHCQSFDVFGDTILRLEACDGEDVTTIITEDVNIEGTLLLEKKVLIKSKAGSVRLNGPVLGSSPTSEITCEASKIVLKGQIANFKYAELYARETITIQNEKLNNIERLSIDCADLSMFNVEVDACKSTTINCESITASGRVTGSSRKETFTVYSTNIHSKLDFKDLDKLEISCKRSTILKGNVENVRCVDVDSKWLNCSAEIADCEDVKLMAWAIATNDQIRARQIHVTALSAFINNSALLATTCGIVAPFVLSLTPLSAISSSMTSINSLCLCTRNDLMLSGTAFLWLAFDPLAKRNAAVNTAEINAWKATSTMMRDRWNTSSIDADEILIGLKYISDLQPVKVHLNTENKVYESLIELCLRFDSTPISLLNFGELVGVLGSARSLFTVLSESSHNQRVGRKKSDSSLYEALVPFKTGKYSKESMDSSDTDIGYVSRSSSEDLNVRPCQSRSTRDDTSKSLFGENHLQEIEKKVEQIAHKDVDAPEERHEQLAYTLREEEELAEFEELENEMAMADEGIIRTDYVVCHDRSIYLARLKEKVKSFRAPRPKSSLPMQRIPSSNDLVMKKLQVKSAISSLDLRSFGSQSSLTSLDFSTVPDFGSPLAFQQTTPFQRSKIPMGSFRSPKKVPSRCGTPIL